MNLLRNQSFSERLESGFLVILYICVQPAGSMFLLPSYVLIIIILCAAQDSFLLHSMWPRQAIRLDTHGQ